VGVGLDSPWHWLIIAIILVLLFGSKRLPDGARALGRSLRIFKAEVKHLNDDDDESKAADQATAAALPPPLPPAAQPPAAAPPAAASPAAERPQASTAQQPGATQPETVSTTVGPTGQPPAAL